jgi:hypothetical protein|tara:strand:- start:923 stop:1144 length:222 start_codon:yes stop_codon:yes gene_type:complete
MRFYMVQILSESTGCSDVKWFTNRAEAELEFRKHEGEEDTQTFSVHEYDIPTKKTELLRWLNNYGNPNGMGFN